MYRAHILTTVWSKSKTSLLDDPIYRPDLFLDQAVRLRISGSCLGEFDDQWYGCRAYCGPLSVAISSGGPHMMNHWVDLLIIDCIFLTR